MYCRKCGWQNDDHVDFCQGCGEMMRHAGQRTGPVVTIPNYMTQAVLVTLFCCVPFGIVAIVNASRVNSRALEGDVEGAREASENAFKWIIASFVIGLCVISARILIKLNPEFPQ